MAFKGDPDEAYQAWAQMNAAGRIPTGGWYHLLVDGGILDQPEVQWADVLTIEFMDRRVREDQEQEQ